MNPYRAVPEKGYWKHAIAARSAFDVSELWDPKFRILQRQPIVTFGSCFAQHFAKALQGRGMNWLDAEPAPKLVSDALAVQFGYRTFSARTANIYTPSLLFQWLSWAFGEAEVPDEVWKKGDRFIDPFRPRLEPDGFETAETVARLRRQTLKALRDCVMTARVFVFTLGLTESWLHQDGYEYPMCPGTAGGEFDASKHRFVNQRVGQVHESLEKAIALMRTRADYLSYRGRPQGGTLAALNDLLYFSCPLRDGEEHFMAALIGLGIRQEGAAMSAHLREARRATFFDDLRALLGDLREEGLAHFDNDTLPELLWDTHMSFCEALMREGSRLIISGGTPGSRMAQFCVAGKLALYEYCTERGVPHANCGKLIHLQDHQFNRLQLIAVFAQRQRVAGVALPAIKDVAQRVGAFRVFRIAHQAVRPFVHLPHGGAFGVQRIGEAVERFELMIISRLELQVLAGVILRGLYRLSEAAPTASRSPSRPQTFGFAVGCAALVLVRSRKRRPRPTA